MRKCRFCHEDIEDAATVCKHCGRNLSTVASRKNSKVSVAGILLGVLIFVGWCSMSLITQRQTASSVATAEIATKAREDPIALMIHQDGLSIENHTESPLDNCFVEILGGFVAQVPVIPARGRVDRNFVVLFDSEDHEFQAHVAGKTFDEFVLANATAKTSVACQDINNHHVTALFHQ
jgi:hypothetical protein